MTWNWFSFVVGLLIGWLVEWIIDWVYWRRRRTGISETETSLRAELNSAKSGLDKVKGDAGSAQKVCQDRIDQLNQELLALRAEKDALSVKLGDFDGRSRVDLDQHAADLTSARGEIDRLDGDLGRARMEIDDLRAQVAAAHSTAAASLDDAHGEIDSLRAKLASTAAAPVVIPESRVDIAAPVIDETVELDHAIKPLDVDVDMPDVDVDMPDVKIDAPVIDKTVELDHAVKPLDVDVDMPDVDVAKATPVVDMPTRSGGRDDLTVIEGIGPKIAGLLRQAGINTFAELASASQERLHQILSDAGSRFQMADPTTWPEQSALAAAGKWDTLKTLQDTLQAGKRT